MIICNGDLRTCLMRLQMMVGTTSKLVGGSYLVVLNLTQWHRSCMQGSVSVRVAAPWIMNSAGFRPATHLHWFDPPACSCSNLYLSGD